MIYCACDTCELLPTKRGGARKHKHPAAYKVYTKYGEPFYICQKWRDQMVGGMKAVGWTMAIKLRCCRTPAPQQCEAGARQLAREYEEWKKL